MSGMHFSFFHSPLITLSCQHLGPGLSGDGCEDSCRGLTGSNWGLCLGGYSSSSSSRGPSLTLDRACECPFGGVTTPTLTPALSSTEHYRSHEQATCLMPETLWVSVRPHCSHLLTGMWTPEVYTW